MSLDTIFPVVSWEYFVHECYHDTAVHTRELDNSQLRRSISVDHESNGVTYVDPGSLSLVASKTLIFLESMNNLFVALIFLFVTQILS